MTRWAKVAAITAGGGGVAIAGALGIATVAWNRAAARTVARLHAEEDAEHPSFHDVFSRDQLAGLPPSVARYFEITLAPGQRIIRRAELRFEGTFAARPERWAPFTAEQHFTTRPPGFVWDASIRMVPPLSVRVLDNYLGGEGAMLAKIASLVPVADQRGTPEMAAGALLRYLAEAPWFPTALLPGDGISWTPVDDTTARVTLIDGETEVSLDARFGPRGEILGIAAMRHRDVNGTGVLTRWVGRNTEWKRVHGMMIPVAGEVAWVLPDGEAPYCRWRVVDAAYTW